MWGYKGALALRVLGLVFTVGVLAVVITPSTALRAGGASSLAAFKHRTRGVAPDDDQSSAYGFESTFPADPPAEPYLGPDRRYERPVSYVEDGDDLSVSDQADSSLKHLEHRSKARREVFESNGSEQLATLDRPAVSLPPLEQDARLSGSGITEAAVSSVQRTDPRPLLTAQTPVPVAYPEPPTL